MMRKRVEAPDRVDSSHRCVCAHRPNRDRAECLSAVGPLQLAKRVREVFKLGQVFLGRRSVCSDVLLPIGRLDRGDLTRGVRQSAYFANALATTRAPD